MATKIIANSDECMKSELDLFNVPPTNSSIDSSIWSEVSPMASLEGSGPIEFNVVGNGEEYIDISKTNLYLVVSFDAGPEDTTDSTNWKTQSALYGPVNNLASSLFKQIEVLLNNESVESSNSKYPYKAYITDLLNYGKEEKETFLQSSLFYKDTAGNMEKSEENAGYVKRKACIKNGLLELNSRIHCDFFNTNLFLIGGVNVKISLTRNDQTFFMMKFNDAKYKLNVKITEAILQVRKCKINPQVLIAHNLALEKATAKYPIRRVQMVTYSIPTNMHNFSTPNITNGVLPVRVVVGMVESSAYNGSYNSNPFNFQNFDMKEISLSVDGKYTPYSKPINFDFKKEFALKGYLTLYEAAGNNGSNDLTKFDYMNGYTFVVFNLAPDLCQGENFNLLKSGELVINIKFGTQTTKTIVLIAYMEFDNMIEINSARKVSKDFTT